MLAWASDFLLPLLFWINDPVLTSSIVNWSSLVPGAKETTVSYFITLTTLLGLFSFLPQPNILIYSKIVDLFFYLVVPSELDPLSVFAPELLKRPGSSNSSSWSKANLVTVLELDLSPCTISCLNEKAVLFFPLGCAWSKILLHEWKLDLLSSWDWLSEFNNYYYYIVVSGNGYECVFYNGLISLGLPILSALAPPSAGIAFAISGSFRWSWPSVFMHEANISSSSFYSSSNLMLFCLGKSSLILVSWMESFCANPKDPLWSCAASSSSWLRPKWFPFALLACCSFWNTSGSVIERFLFWSILKKPFFSSLYSSLLDLPDKL